MKNFLILGFILCTLFVSAQPNTDVFLFDLNTDNGAFELSNMRNVSNNEGYDNQPSFLDNNTILYSGTRNGQTDIVRYNIDYDSKIFINHTEGSEYSPLKIPETNAVSSIRLEKDGTQALYSYSLKNGESEILVEDIIIGYHVWQDKNTIVSSVLEDGGLSLFSTRLNDIRNYRHQKNIGRSLHKIPGTDLVSYISKEVENVWEIKSLNPESGTTQSIAATVTKGAEDMCWLSNGTILMGFENKLYTYRPKYNVDWNEVASLDAYEIKNITRIAVSPDGTKLAVVGEGGKVPEETNTSSVDTTNESDSSDPEEAEQVVKLMMEAYNQRDIEKYMSYYSDDVKLYNYPNELATDGAKAMRDSYSSLFENTPDLNGHIKERIVQGNKVIDKAQVTINGNVIEAIAIYEVEKGKIKRVTFIY